MEARQNLQRVPRLARVVTALLVVVIVTGLWQAYGSWLMGVVGEHGS